MAYDLRLAQYRKALELYREVIEHEAFNRSNVDYATWRIEQLSGRIKEPSGRKQ